MHGRVNVLFLSNQLFPILCDHFYRPGFGEIHTERHQTSEEIEGGLKASFLHILDLQTIAKKGSENDYQRSYQKTPMNIFCEIWNTHCTTNEIPNFLNAVKHYEENCRNRIVRIDGLVSWRTTEQRDRWMGDVVVFDTDTQDSKVWQFLLHFSDPLQPDRVPLGLNGQKASVLTYWDPHFRSPDDAELLECKVIAVLTT